jgi:hypothetical protein
MSTLGAVCFDGTGGGSAVPQALLSFAGDQGSNMAELFCETRGGALDAIGGLEGAAGGAERLNAELKFDDGEGDETLVDGGAGGGAGDVKPEYSSSANGF